MRRRPPKSTRTDTLFPYTTLFRSLAKLLQRLDAGHPSAGLGIRRGIAAIGRQPAGELPHVDISRILRQLAALADAGTVVVPQIAEPFDVGGARISSEERRVGKEGVGTGRSRGAPEH